MGTQYGPTAENFFDFFQKIILPLWLWGQKPSNLPTFFEPFYYFHRQSFSPLLLLWGRAKSTLVKINSK